MKAMIASEVDLERTVNILETIKNLLMKTNEELLFCLSQIVPSGGRTTDKLPTRTLPVYLGFRFNFEKATMKYRSKEVFQLLLFISKLREN